jgi:hypothetical protein
MTEDETLKELIEDLISAMEYHVEQTRQIHSTTVALQAARETLKSLTPQRTEQEPVAYLCENAAGHRYFRWKKPTSLYKPIPLYARTA